MNRATWTLAVIAGTLLLITSLAKPTVQVSSICQSKQPCQNGGICTDEYPGYTCKCSKFHEGRNCEIVKDVNHVLNSYCADVNGETDELERKKWRATYDQERKDGQIIYMWRCHHSDKNKHNHTDPVHKQLADLADKHPEFQENQYILGKPGDNCHTTCDENGEKQCSDDIETIDSIYLFHKFGAQCVHTMESEKDYRLHKEQPMYFPHNNECWGFVDLKKERFDCRWGYHVNGRRICKCV